VLQFIWRYFACPGTGTRTVLTASKNRPQLCSFDENKHLTCSNSLLSISVKKGWILFLFASTTFESNEWILSKVGMNIMPWEVINCNSIVKLPMPMDTSKNVQKGLQQEVLSILTKKEGQVSLLELSEVCVKCGIIQ
jgi:hypothetical protein